MKALCNNVKTKVYFYELVIKLSKLVNTPLNVKLSRNWGSEFVVVSNNFDI